MDPEVQQFILEQLVVITLPIGTLFAIWVWMLSLKRETR